MPSEPAAGGGGLDELCGEETTVKPRTYPRSIMAGTSRSIGR